MFHKSDVEALIGRRPYEEEKVVTFDVEESKTDVTTEQNTNAETATATDISATSSETNSEASTETHS